MSAPPWLSRRVVLSLLAVVLFGAGVAAYFLWWRQPKLPAPGEPRYEEYVAAFQLGTAYLDSGLAAEAEEHLTKAVTLVPGEPAGWANRGLLYLRDGKRDKEAAADIARARKLAPTNPDILELAALLAERQGNRSEALDLFRQASEADATNVRRLYAMARLTAAEAKEGAEARQLELLAKIIQAQPSNLPALIEQARLAVTARDRAALKRALDNLAKLAPDWTGRYAEDTRQMLARVQKQADGPLGPPLLSALGQLNNLLKGQAIYARSMEAMSPQGAQVASPLQQFLVLAPLKTTPDEPDTALTFVPKEWKWAAEARKGGWTSVFPVWLNGKDKPVVFVANAKEVRRADSPGPALTFPSGTKAVPPSLHGIVAVDWNNDYKTDLLLAGAGGLRFYQHKSYGAFEDVTAATKLPAKVLGDDYFGAWAVDYDFDGDLDLLLARRSGALLLLRNNSDGTFKEAEIFRGVDDARDFVWLDLDNDGAADAALLDARGGLHIFMNQRSGQFVRREAPDVTKGHYALAAADVNDDGVLDLIVWRMDGLYRVSDRDKGLRWDVARIAESAVGVAAGQARLAAVDLDNNGALDLLELNGSATKAWLADGKGGFTALAASLPSSFSPPADLDGDGAMELFSLDAAGRPQAHTAKLTRGYRWLDVQARAATGDVGDARINSYALGSEAELRTGLLVVKQIIDRPTVHFGLGTHQRADLMRFVWTNGQPQYEFAQTADAIIQVVQRLKGSCPFLYAHDGEKIAFVTDFCWSTPLGMYINAQNTGALATTTDWVKVRGDQLRPRDGVYDLRVNANLWETNFLDRLSLVVVDHPPGTEMYVDERFFLTPTKLQVYLTGPSRPVSRARDHHGTDVTDVVRAVDGRYLDTCGRGKYQGVTKDHWVEIDLGDQAPKTGPVYLLATGWVHPTDSSINFAMEQGRHVRPMPLTLEVPDGKGGWKAAGSPLGFPAGKNKTCVIRLDGIDGPGVARRVRLRTNLEIFWDALRWAKGLDANQCKQQTLPIRSAELRYRGIVEMTRASRSAPSLAHYDRIAHRGQAWRDLIGLHTRFGDVKELLEKDEGRYVIMNAGDEIALTFTAPPEPEKGWRRDFIWACDGWTKDGDLNTRWGKTVLPLPYRGMLNYTTPPGRLEEDPVYQKFPKDWETYHTRFVTPAVYERGLRHSRRPR